MAAKGKRVAKEALLTDGGELSALCNAALEEVFCRFDVDGDGVFSDSELDEFAKACNGGKAFSKEEKQELASAFLVDAEGRLTKMGFLQMFHLQTSAEPSETWQDLKALGYDNGLQLTTSAEESA